MKTIKVRLTFLEPLLGTWPANPNVAREYIASKSPDAGSIEDEVAALGAEAAADKAMTVFPRSAEGQPKLFGVGDICLVPFSIRGQHFQLYDFFVQLICPLSFQLTLKVAPITPWIGCSS